ncbi:MAG: alpha-galactosidase [Bacteroidota bacterium]|nr:alpha-galactosidase [Bacteroidota bacterium]
MEKFHQDDIGKKIRILFASVILIIFSATQVQSQTTFKAKISTGEWSVFSASQSLQHITSTLNGKNILLNARSGATGFKTNIDGLLVNTQLRLKDSKWVQLSVSVFNPTSDTLYIESFEPIITDCENALKNATGEDLRIMWESATYEVGRDKDYESYYYAALYSDKNRMGPAWMLTYKPPQLWTSMIKKQGNNLSAFVNFRRRKFPVNPGETITFDPVLLSAEFNTMKGWQAIGKMYRPTMPPSEYADHSGFNTWDFFRGAISTKELKPVLNSLNTFNKTYPVKLHNFTLDDGWFPQRGTWEFDLKKFPEGEKGWAKIVHNAGMIPGVWISPFWSNKEIIDKYHMAVREEVADNVIRYRVDPSDPNVKKYVIERFRELSQSGYKYFKIDFLALAYTDKPFRYSKFPPERVIREFLSDIRKAIGKDAFLLGCSTVMASCAMVCDGARIMADITENWSVTKDIYKRIAYRYWMNGNLFNADPDFFVGRGPKTLKEGAFPGYALESGDRQYEGFDYTKAKTWAAMCFALGGHFNWGDNPDGVKKEISDLAAKLAQFGPGKPGVPLDLMDTEQPTKWYRENNGRKYIIVINTDNKPVNVAVKVSEVKELSNKHLLKDIFTGEQIPHVAGDLEIHLKAYDSKCLLIK